MPPKHLAYLQDIVDSIGLIRSYTEGMSATDYQGNTQVRDAVERRFAVIGEALNRLKRDAPDVHAKIDHTAEIAAFRNIIIHVYDQLDHTIVWKTIQTDLELLSQQAKGAIDSTD
ncbi:MAG: DUF86 domain-containing protein [Phycisphaeraceae bacterium]